MDTYFPLMVFNYDDWRLEDNYMTVVRPEENHGFQDEPHFSMHEKFNICILCLYESDQALYHITKSIPQWDDFSCFIVQEMSKEELAAAEKLRKETG